MKNLFSTFLLFVFYFSNAQEGSYIIKSFLTNTKDSSTFVVDVKEEKIAIHCLNKNSHLPIVILLSTQGNELTFLANEQGSTAITFNIDDYLITLSKLFGNNTSSMNLEKVEKQNSAYNYRCKLKELQVEARLDTGQSSCLLYLQLLKLNPWLFSLNLPADSQIVKLLRLVEKNVEASIQINFIDRKIEDTIFDIPISVTKIKIDKSKISEKEYGDFIKNMNNNF